MTARFVIEDELHCEVVGEHPTLAAAEAEIERLARLPWDAAPNRAPCTAWPTCGRRYVLLEFDAETPERRVARRPVLEIDANGVQWHRRWRPRARLPYELPIAGGLLCAGVVLGLGRSGDVGEGAALLVWLAVATLLAAACGYGVPRFGWRAGAVLMAVQPTVVFALTIFGGSAARPVHSTGGLVGVFLATTIIAVASPLPILAGSLAARLRRRRMATAGCQSGRT